MKFEVDTNLLFPKRLRRLALFALAPAAFVAFAAVANADAPAKFKDGETLSAAKLNQRFSDLEARLGSGREAALVPTGTIAAFGGTTVPDGWLPADGTLLDSAKPEYKPLYAVIGISFGGSVTSGMFNLPDFRGRFLRGADNEEGNDPDAAKRVASNEGGNEGDMIGSLQASAVGPHSHPKAWGPNTTWSGDGNYYVPYGSAEGAINEGEGSSSETRPVNVAVNWMIKL